MDSVMYLFSLLILASVVFTMYSSKRLEGYPSGYLGDCPGSEKPAIITAKSLKYLSFTVQGPGSAISARRTKYTYYQTQQLAKDPDLDFDKKTVLYVGGFLDSPNFPVAWIIGKHYRDVGYNVMLLDMNMFTTTEYPVAARYMRPVGKHSAEMLANLTKRGLDPKKLELIGLSLGGQAISYIAKNYRLLTGLSISRLTALDPSGPCFRNLGPEERLDQSDADYVDVIQTNIDGFGMAAPVGHANFYVNGGEYQFAEIAFIPCNIVCSHIRSYTLWLAVLDHPSSFIAIQCDSVQQARDKNCFDRQPQVTNIVGLNTDKSKHGIFYLATSNSYPYYMGKKGLKKENDVVVTYLKGLNENNFIKI